MRSINKAGRIVESMHSKGKKHGYARFILVDGEHVVGYCKMDRPVGVHVHYDNEGQEMRRIDFGNL